MNWSNNLSICAWLVPLFGITTMLCTELLACTIHFRCLDNFPTLSYAATFQPESYVFLGGMCLTALFIFVSDTLFFLYVRLRMQHQKLQREVSGTKQMVASYLCVVFGTISAVSLSGLAVMDMRTYHEAHIGFTLIFFISAWIMMIAVHLARKAMLHEDEMKSADGKVSKSEGFLMILRRRFFWLSLRRWRQLDSLIAYVLGRFMLTTGLTSTFLFGAFFLCANGMWPNPLGFTAVQEAFFEALAIVCQLLFMGTLSCELAHLARLLEYRDYTELERSDSV